MVQPRTKSSVVNQVTASAQNAPRPTAAPSLLAFIIQAQQSLGKNINPGALPLSLEMTAAIQALTKGQSSSIGQSHQTIAPSQSASGRLPIRNLNLRVINPAKKIDYETY